MIQLQNHALCGVVFGVGKQKYRVKIVSANDRIIEVSIDAIKSNGTPVERIALRYSSNDPDPRIKDLKNSIRLKATP